MSIDKKELVRRVQERLSKGSGTVEKIIDATVEEIYESLKLGESVSLRNFGTFYVRVERELLITQGFVISNNPSARRPRFASLIRKLDPLNF